jgi:hypothetical protein
VLYDEAFAAAARERIAAVRERFTWDNVLAPLVSFCRNPSPAADRLPGTAPLVRNKPLSASQALRRDLDLFKSYLDAGGPGELTKRAAGRVRRIAAERWQARKGQQDG